MTTKSKISIGRLALGTILLVNGLSNAVRAQSPGPLPAALSDIRIGHVTYSVQDLDREAEWYTRVLGFKETKRNERPNMSSRNLENGHSRIDLIKYTGSKRIAADPVYLNQGMVHLALTVPDIPTAFAALKALNTDVKGKDVLILHDPEGNEIEIFPAAN